ncbi:MAG: invasion associated locus B family protein [Rickettsiales bacterium]
MRLSLCFIALFALFTLQNANAQTLHQTFGDWKVFTHKDGSNTLCYIASTPIKKDGNFSRRDDPFVLVTFRSARTDEISVSSGFPYKKGSEVSLKADKKEFKLFSQNDRAWAYDEKEDSQIIDRIAKGKTMMVKGTSQKGTFAEDTYSLTGFTKAHRAMKALCK